MAVQDQKVSVLMPVYNAATTIEQSVTSVRAQTHGNWELLIIDDASQDGSAAVAQSLAAADSRIKVHTLPRNQGAAAARNHGLAQASGRYIAFLDADDLWHPEKLSRQLAFMDAREAAISFTRYVRMAANGAQTEDVRVGSRLPYDQLLKRNVMGCLTVIYDAQRLGKVSMPDLTRQQDYALWLKLVKAAGEADGLDEALAIYRIGRGTLSSNKAGAARDIWRIYREHEGLDLVSSAWYFAHYAFYGIRYRLFQRPASDAVMVDTSFGSAGK
jgi:teichuronic acid biosynthesis glycosyltransferase TuaG